MMKVELGIAYFIAVPLYIIGVMATLIALGAASAMPSMASADGVALRPSPLAVILTWGWYLLPYAAGLPFFLLVPARSPHCGRAFALSVFTLVIAPLLMLTVLLFDATGEIMEWFAYNIAPPWDLLPPLQLVLAVSVFFLSRRFCPNNQ